MKKIVTMQDISSVGKCSLTLAIPTLSAMGIEVIPLPAAVLSSHTAFENVYFHDCTEILDSMMDAWEKEGFVFDCVYTAYLGSLRQIEIAKRLFSEFGDGHLKIIDPCMADHGKLYRGFDINFVDHMRDLCKHGDILTPNITEACLLLGLEYQESFSRSELEEIARKLCVLGCKSVIITGASFCEGRVGALAYDGNMDVFSYYDTERLNQDFHGTGDLFTSVLSGALVQGCSLENSIHLACDFVHDCILTSICSEDHSYGIQFEKQIPNLIHSLSLVK